MLKRLRLSLLRLGNYRFLNTDLSTKIKMGFSTLSKRIHACLVGFQMLNLSTDCYKTSIGDYFSALCGDYTALRIIKFLYTGGEANYLACDKITDSVGRAKKKKIVNDIISEIVEINFNLQKIHIALTVFNIKGYLPDNMYNFIVDLGLAVNGYFDVEKAQLKVNLLIVKRKQLLAEHKANTKITSTGTGLSKSALSEQIAAINHAGGNINLKSSVAEYFSELSFLVKQAKKIQNGR